MIFNTWIFLNTCVYFFAIIIRLQAANITEAAAVDQYFLSPTENILVPVCLWTLGNRLMIALCCALSLLVVAQYKWLCYCYCIIYMRSGKSGPKDQVALHYYYTCAWLTRYRNCKFHNGCRTISRHADGISRYSVPPSAGPLLPLSRPDFVGDPGQTRERHKHVFLPRDAMLTRYVQSSCVHPSVCTSVISRYCVKTAKLRITQTTPHDTRRR